MSSDASLSSSSTQGSNSHSASPTSFATLTSSSGTSSLTALSSSTFDPIHPTPSQDGGGNGSRGGNASNGGQTSASLYLYTFLATLVLLLSVSAAIILRSLLLRRRHQRMVEEAIRNGTWVPPSPGGSNPFLFGNGGRRIDLTKKPKMWEAFVGSREPHVHTQRTGKAEAVTEWEWDSIRPFAATYVDPPVLNDPALGEPSVTPPERPSLTARLQSLARGPRRRTPASIFAGTRMATVTTPAPVIPVPPLGAASPPPAAPAVPDPPQKVRVAVLIAMPQPPEPKSRSPTPQPVASTSAAVIPSQSTTDEELELPHIEFGVAELDVSSHAHLDRAKDIRSSVASGSSGA